MSAAKPYIESVRPEFEKAVKFLEGELAKIRTSRASPSLVEDVSVTVSGQKFAIKQLGNISSPQPNQLLVQPWDGSYLEPMEKAISQAGLGLSVAVDKNLLRLTLPSLTEEYRQQLAKVLGEKGEQARQTVRRWREEAWSNIQKAEKDKKISQDDKFKGKDDLQKVVDDFNEKIKNLIEKKKVEIS